MYECTTPSYYARVIIVPRPERTIGASQRHHTAQSSLPRLLCMLQRLTCIPTQAHDPPAPNRHDPTQNPYHTASRSSTCTCASPPLLTNLRRFLRLNTPLPSQGAPQTTSHSSWDETPATAAACCRRLYCCCHRCCSSSRRCCRFFKLMLLFVICDLFIIMLKGPPHSLPGRKCSSFGKMFPEQLVFARARVCGGRQAPERLGLWWSSTRLAAVLG